MNGTSASARTGSANSNTALFLMELIVVIGFFSLVSVICVRLFVAASRASTESVDLNHGTRTAESLAEAWIACDGDLDALARLYPEALIEAEYGTPQNGTCVLLFDEDWQAVAAEGDADYSVRLTGRLTDAAALYEVPSGGRAVAAKITATALADGREICVLTPDHYLGEGD